MWRFAANETAIAEAGGGMVAPAAERRDARSLNPCLRHVLSVLTELVSIQHDCQDSEHAICVKTMLEIKSDWSVVKRRLSIADLGYF